MTIKADEKSVYGKKVRSKKHSGSHGCKYELTSTRERRE